MCLYWGVTPLASAPVNDSRALVRFVTDWGKQNGLLSSGRPHRAHCRHGYGDDDAQHDCRAQRWNRNVRRIGTRTRYYRKPMNPTLAPPVIRATKIIFLARQQFTRQ